LAIARPVDLPFPNALNEKACGQCRFVMSA
jgi:hypothetical protein